MSGKKLTVQILLENIIDISEESTYKILCWDCIPYKSEATNGIIVSSIICWMLLESTHGYWIDELNLSLASKIKFFLYLPSRQIWLNTYAIVDLSILLEKKDPVVEFQNHKKNRYLETGSNEYLQTDQFSQWPEWPEAREHCKKSRVKCKVHLYFNKKSYCFVDFHVNPLQNKTFFCACSSQFGTNKNNH
ncbi:hypothetical protein QE152_g36791 [Popillia japonica]|uniref:Uncharacterized protein n=1 Tax=Popillia japonica TaxID=7064 RepID=A0AAW1IBU5_POPJA